MPINKVIGASVIFITILTGCSSLPKQAEHLDAPLTPKLTSALSTLNDRHNPFITPQTPSAVLVQNTGWDALAQRLALVEAAEHTIDIQYYIWNSDSSGRYLASRLVAAADRGVYVRVLLDDINLNDREALLTKLDAHPNIDIRIFNPIPTRNAGKWISFVGDFSRLNRRMHNKSFTVDGAFTVVGGRNIGDEYFDLSHELNLRDRDVLASGKVVADVQRSFNDYWNSEWAYSVDLLRDKAKPLPQLMLNTIPVPEYKNYPALPQSQNAAMTYLSTQLKKMTGAKATYIADKPIPDDVDNTDQPKATAQYLSTLAKNTKNDIIIESAYLVFDDKQLEGLQQLSQKGVEIKALTNSMASNDLVTNHSGYAGRRQDMLESGMDLYELKPDAKLCKIVIQDNDKCAPNAVYGLHAKSAVFDHQIATIGSFNFNLRSTYLNTESLLVIENPKIATELATTLEGAMQDTNSWHLSLDDGDVYWHSGNETWDSEPNTKQWDRMKSELLQLLPIEKYL
ncbi:phospholipase D family protein [Photobacterium sp. GB-36]|uniref:phospholipase D family protein n=1 Tax=Photobacterium sp. GB-36 TaxID=2022108 RepID=UPI000D15906C|nr:phospholipase D family protein [Photobacterium sp. GB-36]PSV45853.1 phospholipase D family protein [Photobacterium sp. GB-36]